MVDFSELLASDKIASNERQSRKCQKTIELPVFLAITA